VDQRHDLGLAGAFDINLGKVILPSGRWQLNAGACPKYVDDFRQILLRLSVSVGSSQRSS
jgi:hypothetical protein